MQRHLVAAPLQHTSSPCNSSTGGTTPVLLHHFTEPTLQARRQHQRPLQGAGLAPVTQGDNHPAGSCPRAPSQTRLLSPSWVLLSSLESWRDPRPRAVRQPVGRAGLAAMRRDKRHGR